METTDKILASILIDLNGIIWAPSKKNLWKRHDDEDLIKLCRKFKRKKLRIHLENRFPDKTFGQCKARYNNSYCDYIKKHFLEKHDIKYIKKNYLKYNAKSIAIKLGVSIFIVSNKIARIRNRKNHSRKSITSTENLRQSDIPNIQINDTSTIIFYLDSESEQDLDIDVNIKI
jgi:hypothetical protein